MIFPAGQYLCLPQQNASLGGNKMRFDVMPVATEKQISEIEKTANNVWHNYYRDIFSKEITEKIKSHPNITVENRIYDKIWGSYNYKLFSLRNIFV